MKSQIVYLYEFNHAENERMWAGIRKLSNEQWGQAHEYSRGSVHDHIVHVMYATTRWTYALRSMGQMPPLEPAAFPEVEAAYQRWQTLWTEINGYVLGLTDEQLMEMTQWGLPRRGLEGEAPLWQLLHHLANHALDHRVQVMVLLESRYGVKMAHEYFAA